MRSEAVVNELVRGRRPLQRLVNTIALLAPAFVWVMVAALALTSVIGVIILAVDDADVASFIIRNDINGAIRIELLRAISLTPPLTALAAFLLVLSTQSKRRVDQLVWLSKLVSPLVVAYPVRTLCEYSVWADRQLEFLCWLALTGFIFERLMRSSLEALEVFSEPVAPVIARVRGLRVFEYLPLLLVILGAAAFALFVGYFTFQQHHRIQTAGYDLGIYDNLMFNALHGHPYRSPVLWGSAGGNYVANHAELAQILFVPFYALRPGPEALLTIQAVMMGGSAIPLYFLARTTLSKLSASAITFCWLIGAALISPLFYDFHWLPIAVPFHLTLMYALVTRRWKLAVFAFLMAVLIREDVGLIIAIGSTIFITTKWNVRLGVGLMVTSIIWFLGIKFVLMPSLGKWNFEGLYAGLIAPGDKGFGGVIKTVLVNPTFFFETLLTKAKLTYMLHLLVPLAFLPWRNWRWALFSCGGFIITLMTTTNNEPQTSIRFHYTMHWLPYLFAASLLALHTMGTRGAMGTIHRRAALSAVVLSCVLHSLTFGPFFQRSNFVGGFQHIPFSISAAEMERAEAIREAKALIPDTASVSATELECPQISTRLTAYTTKIDIGSADFLLLNRNHIDSVAAEKLNKTFTTEPYGLVFERGEILLFQRGVERPETERAVRSMGLSWARVPVEAVP